MGGGPPSLTGAVLTGGASRRMGADKALLEVDGRPLVTRAGDALVAAGADPVLAVGGDASALDRLGFVAVPDLFPGAGPLGGVLTALHRAPGEVVAVLACDLTGVRADGVRAVVDTLIAHPSAPAAFPVVGGRAEPLHAAWRRSALGGVEAAFATGERAVHRVLEGLGAVPVVGLDPSALTDADGPGDLVGPSPGRDVVSGGHTGGMPEPDDLPEIDVDQLARLRDEGAWILDVRQPDEYDAGHVPGAHLVPLDQLGSHRSELPSDQDVYVVCRSGSRSAVAVQALNRAGHRAVNVAGGTVAWAESGRSVVRGPQRS